VVDSSDSIKVVRELDRVIDIDVSAEVASLFTVVVDAVDDALVCRIVESVYCDDAAGADVTAVKVDCSADVIKGEDEDKYSLADEVVLDND
jgi:hypothetical protein